MPPNTVIDNKGPKKFFLLSFLFAFFIVIVICAFTIQLSRSPGNFPHNTIITIPTGSTVTEAGTILQNANIIRSEVAFRIYTSIINRSAGIKAGQYFFDKPESALRVAYRTIYGVQDLTKIKITIPEGFDSRNITKLFAGYFH